MATKIRTSDAEASLRKLIQENVKAAAGTNKLVSKEEAKKLDPFVRRAEQELRKAGGRITVDEIVERACADAAAVWARFNNSSPQDAVYLSKAEVKQVAQLDAQLGALTEAAVARLQEPKPGKDLAEAARDFVTQYDFSERRFHQKGLPGGQRVDARPGMSGREGVPAPILQAFDFYYRIEQADWGSTSLHKGKIAGEDVYGIYQTTDGDEAWLELYKADGTPLTSARIWCDELLAVDGFFGRGRLSPTLTMLEGTRTTEGYSEPAEREAAGQIPMGWPGEATLSAGTLQHSQGKLSPLSLPEGLTPEQRALATAALESVWDHVLQHRAVEGQPLELGRQGELRLGTFECPTDGRSYLVADWKDIDDGSYTFYFSEGSHGLQLDIEQFNN